METRDLRVGNYFLCSNKVNRVYGISVDGEIYTEQFGISVCSTHNNRKPILLTEEWLLKFGFTETENKHYVNQHQYTLQLTGHKNEDGSMNEDETWFDGICTASWASNGAMAVNTLCRGNYVCNVVRHAHQLQNLYFALTGEELELNK